MSATPSPSGSESFIAPLDGEKVVSGDAHPVGVAAASVEGEPGYTPGPPFMDPKQMAHTRMIRANLESVRRRVVMSMNRQAPCKIKYEELGAVYNALSAVLK